jgi:ribosome-associated protein
MIALSVEGLAYRRAVGERYRHSPEQGCRIAEGVREAAGEKRHATGKTEGRPQGGWILVDFGSVIVHLFSPDRREYYTLEELWREAKIVLRVQ